MATLRRILYVEPNDDRRGPCRIIEDPPVMSSPAPDQVDSDLLKVRQELAQSIGLRYAEDPRVAAVLLGGSVARGWADQWSDIELGVFWRDVPTAPDRARAAEHAQLTDWRSFPELSPLGETEEDARCDGVKIDLIHLDLETAERAILGVGQPGNLTVEHQAFVSALQDGISLAGQADIARLKATIPRYSDALRSDMVRRHLIFGPSVWLHMLADRNDELILHDLFCRIGRSIMAILHGLNRRYMRTANGKWMHWTIAELRIRPKDLDRRLGIVLHAESAIAVSEADKLIGETLDLIDHHLPVVDTVRTRERIADRSRG